MTGRSHYQVLGVGPSASDAEIRAAYRRLARRHHPDRAAGGSAAGAVGMHEINEAYRVLGDPGRRAVYDAQQRAEPGGPDGRVAPSPPASSPTVDGPPPVRPLEPARVPWRMLLAAGAIGISAVWILAQFTDPGEDPAPDGILRVGDCVEIEPDSDAREVRCTGTDDDLVVRAFVPFDESCPGFTEPHRDRQGMGVACTEIRDVAG